MVDIYTVRPYNTYGSGGLLDAVPGSRVARREEVVDLVAYVFAGELPVMDMLRKTPSNNVLTNRHECGN